jgi:glucose/arabinose dehydrogenase
MRAGHMATALLVCSLLMAACGDDDSSGSSATTRADAPATTATTGGGAPTTTAVPQPKLADVKVTFTKVVDAEEPLAMAAARNGDIYIAEKGGRVRLLTNGRLRQTVIDLRRQVSTGSEQGLLGLALSPDERFLYVNYTDTDGNSHIVEYTTDGRNQRELLKVDQPFANHNGGGLSFGRDGYLYAGFGDGGGQGDPRGNGQNLNTLLAKMLRIDPGGASGDQQYAIPEGNPFADRADARPEVWAYGLRNPWRFSFDRNTGDLWIGDVGGSLREEIDFAPASSRGGENYGWDRFEGTKGSGKLDAYVPPVHEYTTHEDGTCAVVGGYVYRGKAIPALEGAYLYSDSCGGRIDALRLGDDRKVTETATLGEVGNPASFGQDAAGELYVVSLAGGLYRIDAA